MNHPRGQWSGSPSRELWRYGYEDTETTAEFIIFQSIFPEVLHKMAAPTSIYDADMGDNSGKIPMSMAQFKHFWFSKVSNLLNI